MKGISRATCLRALSTISPEGFESIHYSIIEPFVTLRERQLNALSEFGDRIEWHSSLETIEPFIGIHFSNELLDSMPVHLVRRVDNVGNESWAQKSVGWSKDEFVFVEQALTDQRIAQQLEAVVDAPDGTELEINLAALDWVTTLSQRLELGCALTIDYGFVASDLISPRHRAGTLQSRAEHRLIDSPLHFIGNCDITAHVNWTSVGRHAQKQGFTIDGFTDQHHFLTGLITKHPDGVVPDNASARRQLQTLLHPEMMGRSFQVLWLSRGTTSRPALSGFKFARPPREQLGLADADSI